MFGMLDKVRMPCYNDITHYKKGWNTYMKFFKVFFKILGILLLAILALVLLAWSGLHIAKYFMYPDYYAYSDAVSPLPNIHGGFVPQGLGYDAASDTYFHSGYNANGSAVELHLVTDDQSKCLYPIYDGETAPAKGHGGGIAVAGEYVYVADNAEEGDGKVGKLNIFRMSDLKNAKDGDTVKAIGAITVDTSASFCFSDGKYIYVGEFYRAVNYETAKEHHFTTPAGDENKALLSAYPLNTDGTLADTLPAFSVSITDQVQGFAITPDGKIALSRSWGLNASKLTVYNGWTDTGATINTSGKNVPLYFLDSATEEKDISMPAFSEGLALNADGELLISFESACNKYIIGKLFFATNVVAYPMD